MSRAVKLSLLSIVGIIFVFATIILLSTEYASYAILTATVAVIFVSYTVIFYNDTKSHYSQYKNRLRKIINTYDSVLVKSEKLPDMEKHSIIRVASMEDLVYAQMVIKKPIYFYEEERSCSFVLMDNPEICVYILKADSEAVTTTEIIIEEIRKQPEQKVDFDHAILADIENTTIIKLDNKKTYKVSPYRPGERQVTQKVETPVEDPVEKVVEDAVVEQVEPVVEPVKEYIKDITQVFEAINYVNAEIKEDLFIDIEPKKRRKKDQPVNLTKVEKEIDNLVELSNTKVLDLIKTEPVDTKAVKEVLEQKEQEKELIVEEEKREKTTHKQRRQNNNQRNNRKNNNQRTTRKRNNKKQ